MTPEIYVLEKVDWQLFGTLTFRRESMPERVRWAMIFALLRSAARWNKRHFLQLPWAVRFETGEVGYRLHCHYLLSGLRDPEGLTKASRFALKNQWEKLGGGFARVRRYGCNYEGMPSPDADDIGYLVKALGLGGADAYETERFVTVQPERELTISKSCWRIAASSKRRSDEALTRMG